MVRPGSSPSPLDPTTTIVTSEDSLQGSGTIPIPKERTQEVTDRERKQEEEAAEGSRGEEKGVIK
jgi:hypothetical protein